MQVCKQVTGGTRGLLGKSRYIASTLMRSYAKKHSPSPTCSSGGEAKEVCVDDHPKPRSAKDIEKTFPFYNIIKFDRECCNTPCIDKDFPSFDECLYEMSDKNKREYQVTWVECPPVNIKPKKICCFKQEGQRPPFKRRAPKFKPPTACKPTACPKTELECPKLKSPGCRPVAKSTKCHVVFGPSGCKKVKVPYPAFSECTHPKLKKRARSECHCWDEIPMCELFRIVNRRLETGNTNMNPCKKK